MLDQDLQGIIRRMLICGMHVHAGIEDPGHADRSDEPGALFPAAFAGFVDLVAILGGHEMGMKCARLGIFDSMPRTGMPDRFESYSEYERMVERMVKAGALEDSSKIWWDLRPSARFPTLEMRITDVCTRLEDAICIAALYQSILRMLIRLRQRNQRWRIYPRMLMDENRWRAQRYGVTRGLIDLSRGEQIAYPVLIEELIGTLEEEARALGCFAEVQHARTILDRGTSACNQLSVFAAGQRAAAPTTTWRR